MTPVRSADQVISRAATLSGTLRMPSDKSIGHRALLANAIADGHATVRLAAPGADLKSTVGCLRDLGVELQADATATGMMVRLRGKPQVSGGERRLDCGNSGSTMRLLAGLCAALPGTVVLDGDASLRRRPMERVAARLRDMGATITTSGGTAPLSIIGHRPLRGMRHELPVASAQLLGAVLFAGLAADGDTEVQLPSPVRDHSERLLAWMGADVSRDERHVRLRAPARLAPRSIEVPGDPSSAAAWLVAAAVRPGVALRIEGLALNPTRLALVNVLREMGASVSVESSEQPDGPEPVGAITVHGGPQLRAIQLDGARVTALIDELPLVGIAMAAADGGSQLRDAAELRVKESDRIAAMVHGLHAIGARVEELPDGWQVSAGAPRDARIETHGDHRIAIAFAIAAASGVAGDVQLDDAGCVAVSYPTFWSDLAAVSGPEGATP